MSDSSISEISEYEDIELDDDAEEDVSNQNVHGIEFLYRDEMWNKFFCTNDPASMEFVGRSGNTNVFVSFPTIMAVFLLGIYFGLIQFYNKL